MCRGKLDRIVAKALAKDKLKRYQTITDLKLDLEQLRDEVHTLNRRADRDAAASHSFSRNRVCTAGANRCAVTDGDSSRNVGSGASTITEPRSRMGWLKWAVPACWPLCRSPSLFTLRATPAINSVAILPFVNDTKDPNAEYLSDGIN